MTETAFPQFTELPRSVLFMCNRNAVRSPMAKALADKHFRRRVFTASVGLEAGPLDAFAVAAMEEIGLDISRHTAQTLTDLPESGFELVIALTPECREAGERIARRMGAAYAYWPIPDPTHVKGAREQRLEAFRSVRDDLASRMARHFAVNDNTPSR